MRVLVTSMLALSLGCIPHTHRKADEVGAAAAPVPEGYASPTQGAKAPSRWWTAFGDSGLDALMEAVEAQNLDLRRGFARLAQAEAIARQRGAVRMPSIDAQASTGLARQYTGQEVEIVNGAPEVTIVPEHNTPTAASLSVAYEVDVWGKAAAAAKAAGADVRATRLDLEALAMSLSGRVVETWFNLMEQRAQLDLLKAQIELNNTQVELLEHRFANGLASAVDVEQQRQLVASSRAQIPGLEGRIRVLEHALAVLAGRAPADRALSAQAGARLPELPAVPASGLPSDLLESRPDVRAAQVRVEAADLRVGAAIADRYPSLRLSANIALQAQSFSEILDRWLWSITAGLVVPLFDGGRRSAEVDRNKAAVQDALIGLAQTFLVALREVEDALVSEAHQRRTVEALQAQLKVSERLVEQTRLRYTRGLSTYFPVLSALQGIQGVERQLLSARRQLIVYRVQLYRALGGDWTANMKSGGEG